MFIGRCCFVNDIARLRTTCRIAGCDIALLKECPNFSSFTAINIRSLRDQARFREMVSSIVGNRAIFAASWLCQALRETLQAENRKSTIGNFLWCPGRDSNPDQQIMRLL